MRLRLLLLAAAGLVLAATEAAARPAPGLVFEPNRGQTHADVRFLARGEGYTLFLGEREAVFALGDTALRMRLGGARPPRAIEGESALPGRSHYFDLADGRPVARSVEHVGRVRYRDVYAGTDLVYYGRDGRLEYDFELAPGADPRAIALAFEGADDVSLAPDGGLELALAGETVRFEPPVSYQPGPRGRTVVESRYVLDGDAIRFALGPYDRARPLVIDPVFVYATYLGGSDDDRAYDLVVNAAGEAYVTGETASAVDFPLASALDASHGGALDAYVTKFAADGRTVLFSTFLGGPLSQAGHGIALDPAGNIYVVGTNDQNLFELKLDPSASAIVYSHTVGGANWDAAYEVAADAAGNLYLAGISLSADFPTVNALTPNHGGNTKGIFRKLGPTGAVLVSTFLGVGTPSTAAIDIALDPGGNVLLTGYTEVNDPDRDLFVLKLAPSGTSIVYSKILGGTLGDTGVAVAADAGSRAYVGGWTDSSDFPIVGGADASFAAGEGFVLQLDHLGNLLASTYLGGDEFDEVSALAIEPGGAVLAARSSDVAFFARRATTWRLSSNLGAVHAKAYYGSCHFTLAHGVATNANGVAYVAATTPSGCSMPTTSGAFRTSRPGRDNAHVAKIDMTTAATVSIADRSRLEGNTNGLQDFFVSVSSNAAAPVFVDYAAAAGTATVGNDFAAFSGTLEVAPGSGGAYLQVPIVGDLVAEPDETFLLNLSAPVGATIVDGQGLGTIRNDDAPNGTLQLAACSAHENDGVATVTVTRANGSNGPVGVAYATSNGSAASGIDYGAASGTLDWPSGDTAARTFDVALSDDALREGNETFGVALSAPTGGASLGAPASVACTIVDDEPVRTLSVADATVAEGGGAALVLQASGASATAMRATLTTANATASAGADYTAASVVVEIAPGATSAAVPAIATTEDTLEEAAETFVVNLTAPAGATIGDTQAAVTVIDDDEGGTLALSPATLSPPESGANAVFTVTRSGGAASGVTVAYATANGSAAAGADYGARSGTLAFAAGQSQATIAVPVLADTLDEANESFTLTLSAPAGGATLGTPATATATIADDDAPPLLSIDGGGCAVTEGDSGSVACRMTLRLSAASGRSVAFTTATADGTAAAADYTGHTATARSIAAGQTTLVLDLPVRGDATDETDETFTLAASGISNATPASLSGTATIRDDDEPAPTGTFRFGAATYGAAESGGATVTVDRVGGSTGTITVPYATAHGTASAQDYTATSGTLSFGPGVTQRTILVPVTGDALDEADETLTVALAAPSAGSLGTPASALVTIADDDAPPSLRVLDCSLVEGSGGAPKQCVFTVMLSAASGRAVQVDVLTADATATGGADYAAYAGTLALPAGETVVQVPVAITPDTQAETLEAFEARLSNAVNATIADGVGTGTITDDDGSAGTLAFNTGFATTVSESAGSGPIVVTRTGGSVGGVSVAYAITAIDATPGEDFVAQDGVFSWGPGELGNRSASYTLVDDVLLEGKERFRITLGAPTGGAALGTPAEITVTIEDDEDHLHSNGFEGGGGRLSRPD